MCTHQVHLRSPLKNTHFFHFFHSNDGWWFCCRIYAMCLMSTHTCQCLGGSSVAGGPLQKKIGGPRHPIEDLGVLEILWKSQFSTKTIANENSLNFNKNHHNMLKYYEYDGIRSHTTSFSCVGGLLCIFEAQQNIRQHCDPPTPQIVDILIWNSFFSLQTGIKSYQHY